MTLPLVLALLGVALILGAEVISRRRAPRYLVGRTLAAARDVTIEQARQLAETGAGRYVRVHGRISSEEEFPDEHDRPLVYRRKRLEVRQPNGSWQATANETEGVPFGVESRSAFIGVDSAELGVGLVVVPRHAEGVAADLPAGTVAAVDPAAQARLVVEQVSAVEHAFVVGVPRLGPDGAAVMGAGSGRPLILTTLDIADAMRVLGAGQRRFVIVLAGLFGVGLLLLVGALVSLVLGLGSAPAG